MKHQTTRLTFRREWLDTGAMVEFTDSVSGDSYCYPHDEMLELVAANDSVTRTKSWKVEGLYHFPNLSQRHCEILEPYRVKRRPA